MRSEVFTASQRALTLMGLAPAVLFGCTSDDPAPQPAPLAQFSTVPAPAPSVRVAVPPPAPPLRVIRAPQALVTGIPALARAFDGVVGIAVRSVDDGWTVSSNGDLKLPQQSVSKLWVAMTILDLRDQGRLTLADPVTITRADLTLFHQPIATLVGDDGYTTTVGNLLTRAMTTSDNTANDRLMRFAGGPEAVRAFMRRKAITDIRFGPGERLLQSRTAGLEWRQEYSLGNAFAQARARLTPEARRAAYQAYVADPPDGAAASAIATALVRLKRGELLSPGSTALLIATMEASKTGKARLRGAVPVGWAFGHKTGTGQNLGQRTAGYNDVGILTAPDGKSYGIAVMIGDTPRPIKERQELMQAVVASVVANHRD